MQSTQTGFFHGLMKVLGLGQPKEAPVRSDLFQDTFAAISQTGLFSVMQASKRYPSDDEIANTIRFMRREVSDGHNPETVLEEEGFSIHFLTDIV